MTSDVDRFIDEFRSYIASFDYSKYKPYYHGTDRLHLDSILTDGLLTRSSGAESCQVNKWGSEMVLSLPDRVYFAICTERADIVKASCRKAVQLRGDYASTDEQIDEQCVILELVNIEKYVPYFDIDEDSSRAPRMVAQLFSSKTYDDYEVDDAFFVTKKMDRTIARMYEQGFISWGEIMVKKLIELTPPALFSMSDWGTLAITTSIAPDDLREVPYSVYKNRENCRARVGYPDINEKAYREFTHHHDEAHGEAFKQAISRE